MAFDATGGGRLTNTILTCMERAASAGLEYNRYGSDTMKKVYSLWTSRPDSAHTHPSLRFFVQRGWLSVNPVLAAHWN